MKTGLSLYHMLLAKHVLFLICMSFFYAPGHSRTCHHCNVITDYQRPLDRVKCDEVKRAIMRNSSLYTHTCPNNEYCMHYNGRYAGQGGWRYEEFAGCSGKDFIYIGDGEDEVANGNYVEWKTKHRDGQICLSLKDKDCFDCDKSKCDELWPKPDCHPDLLKLVEETADECCPTYICQNTHRTCHYCNIVTNVFTPLNRVPCERVRKAIMRDDSLYTKWCPSNEYCLHFKGQYRDTVTASERYEEFAGCSGDDGIHAGDVSPQNVTGAFVDWKTTKRDGKICLSTKDKSCFDCDKSKCDELWPKPDCPTGTLVHVENTSAQCCPQYKCRPPRTCHYCNIITDGWDPLNRISCEIVEAALLRNGSLYTMLCPYNEYCIHYKGLYKHGYSTREFYVEYAGCSGTEEDIYTEGARGPGNTNGNFVHWLTMTRNGKICLSLTDVGCFECNKSKCDEFWPKPECRIGSLKVVNETVNECCPDYVCEVPDLTLPTVAAVVVTVAILIIAAGAYVSCVYSREMKYSKRNITGRKRMNWIMKLHS